MDDPPENFMVDKPNKQQKRAPDWDRFGGLEPFQHHHVPEENKDDFQYAGHQQRFGGGGQDVDPDGKDPDVWDPPTPPKRNKQSNWGVQQQPKKNLNFNKPKSGGAGGAPRAKKSDAGDPKNRAYEKPWQQPKKEKKEANTFLEYHYPDGAGPDVDLIQMLERDVLDKNP